MESQTFTIDAWPPSVNHIYRPGARKSRLLTEKAKWWYEYAGWVIASQARYVELSGPIECRILYAPPDRRRRDIDNLAKAVLDAVTRSGVWLDDHQVQRLILEWTPARSGGQVTVEIHGYEKENCTQKGGGQ